MAGYPVTDVAVELIDGKYHPVDSKEVAFQMAGKKAIRTALEQGRFAIGDERQRNVDFEFEFSFEFFDRHIEVLLPHAAQCECASEFVVARRKRRIFVDEFVDGDFELVFFALCLRRHIEIHHGSGVLDRLEREIDAATQRIVCARIFEFGDADDIAEDAFFDGIAVATAQDVERSEAFAVARAPKPTTN